ncbi:hypothetical protein ACFLTK_00375 [Chloroflexota bacterium]
MENTQIKLLTLCSLTPFSYVLAQIKLTKEVISGMLRITNQALVLMELHLLEPQAKNPLGLGIYHNGNWVRDYVALLRQFVSEEQIQITKTPKDVWPIKP